jgi:hypothetical protein
VAGDSPSLTDVLREMARADWGRTLFKPDGITLTPGQVMILNNRAVQPWEADHALVQEGSTLVIVPFVAGG